jgi:hypothetical protein
MSPICTTAGNSKTGCSSLGRKQYDYAYRGYAGPVTGPGACHAFSSVDINKPEPEPATDEDFYKVHDMADAFRGYLKDLWTLFSIINALLVSSSIGPFTSPLETTAVCSSFSSRDQLVTLHGVLWTVTIAFNCLALMVSCLAVGAVIAYAPSANNMRMFWRKWEGYALAPLYFTLAGVLCLVFSLAYTAAVRYCMAGLISVVVIAGCVFIVALIFAYKTDCCCCLADRSNTPTQGEQAGQGSTQLGRMSQSDADVRADTVKEVGLTSASGSKLQQQSRLPGAAV